jgi:hypothetical protein
LLPPAAADPGGDPDAAAQALASQVNKGGPGAIAALRRALTRMGFELVDMDGTSVDPPASPPNGGHVIAGELHQLVNGIDSNWSVAMDGLLYIFPVLAGKDMDISALRAAAINDLRAEADSGEATSRFYARFVAALGSGHNPRDDLLKGPPNSVDLDAVQTYLMLSRWSLDLAVNDARHLSSPAALSASPPERAGPLDIGSGTVRLVGSDKCNIDPKDSTYNDAKNTAVGAASGKLAQLLLGAGNIVNDVQSSINAVFGLARFLTKSLGLVGSMSLKEGEPLVRTQDKRPGEKKTIELKIKWKFDGGQSDECERLALSKFGIDYSSGAGGPLKQAPVSWTAGASGLLGPLEDPAALSQVEPKDAANTKTNDDGVTHTGLEGKPQRGDIIQPPKPYMRPISVTACAALKDSQLVPDLISALGVASGKSVIGAITGILDHTPYHCFTKTFMVKDWAQDIRIDSDQEEQNGNNVHPHMRGTKCGGVAGNWTVTITTPSDPGNSGSVDFSLDDQGNGIWQGGANMHLDLSAGKLTISVPGLAEVNYKGVTPGHFCTNGQPDS